MKSINFYLLLLIIGSFVSCKNNTQDNATSINSTIRLDGELEHLIIQKGDRLAYYELSMQYLDYGYEKFLPYSLIMANKYDNPQAYFDTYNCLWNICGNDENRIDGTTQTMAIDYLQKASLRGHSQARETLGKYYMQGVYFEKDTILGSQLIEQAKSLPY